MASDAQDRRLGRLDALSSRLDPLRDSLPNRRRLGFDLAAVTTWVVAVAATLHGVGAPAWLYYTLVVAGVLGLTMLGAIGEELARRSKQQ